MIPKPKMLIVDDAATDRSILKMLFEKDYDVLEAADGICALEVLRRVPDVKIVLLDLIMPRLDGYGVLSAMQKEESLRKIPVLVAAGNAGEEQEALRTGASDFITKPYNGKVLLQRVDNLVNRIAAERERLEHNLQSVAMQLDILSDSIPGGVGAFQRKGSQITALSVNEAMGSLMGYTVQEVTERYGSDVSQAVYIGDRAKFSEMLQALREGRDADGTLFRLNRRDGGVCWVKLCARRMEETEPREEGVGTEPPPVYYVVLLDVSSEVTSEQRANSAFELMRYRAEHDPLTGICNRDNFTKKTAVMLRENPDKPYVLVRWNIERFKVINELFSTNTGDRLLVGIAGILRKLLHDVGTYARFEADHFVLCYPEELITPQELLCYADKKLKEYGLDYGVLSTLGIYRVENRSMPVSQMCDRANLALETVKGNYIRRFAYYDEKLRNNMLAEQQIVSEMNDALEKQEFVVYLQPIFSVSTDTSESAEALVRWKHPKMGMIPPGKFIPLFERNGFITKLDAYVWEKTCAYLSARIKQNAPVVPISVNVSRLNLYNPHLCEEIVALTEKYELPHAMLKLEITESAYMDNPRQLIQTTQLLRDQGFHIMMDDFGSGYSSLNMLKELPVDALKIDMRFLDDVATSRRAGSVVSSVIRMAKWLDMSIVAEGVETKAQLDFLRTVGCECVQGYYYAKPMTMEEFDKLLSENRASGIGNDIVELFDSFDFDALWENRELSLLFNGMLGGMCFFERNGEALDLVRANDGFYDMMGASPGNREAEQMLSNLSEEDTLALKNACRSAREMHTVQTLLLRHPHADGHMMWLESKVRYLGSRRGRALLYFAFNDVTAQRMREQTMLCMDEVFLRYQNYGDLLLDRMPCAVAVFLAEASPRELVYSNGHAWEICGAEPLAGGGTIPFTKLLKLACTDYDAALEAVRQVLEDGEPVSFCWRRQEGGTLTGTLYSAEYYDDTRVLQFLYAEEPKESAQLKRAKAAKKRTRTPQKGEMPHALKSCSEQ